MNKATRVRMLAGLILCTWFGSSATAHNPVEFLEVVDGKPLTSIEHPIEVKSVLDQERATIDLLGPHHFSLSAGCLGRSPKAEKAFLAWYKIENPKPMTSRKVKVLDLVRGMKTEPFEITTAEYFLTPAQRITTGPPSEVPVGLDHYKAYRIVDAPALELEVEIKGSVGDGKRTVGRPVLLCVPAEEWHHAEYFPATHPSGCFVVYELDASELSEQYSFIDQFGLNQLGASASRWLCVRGALSSK